MSFETDSKEKCPPRQHRVPNRQAVVERLLRRKETAWWVSGTSAPGCNKKTLHVNAVEGSDSESERILL